MFVLYTGKLFSRIGEKEVYIYRVFLKVMGCNGVPVSIVTALYK